MSHLQDRQAHEMYENICTDLAGRHSLSWVRVLRAPSTMPSHPRRSERGQLNQRKCITISGRKPRCPPYHTPASHTQPAPT